MFQRRSYLGGHQQERVVQRLRQMAGIRGGGVIAENDRGEQRKIIKYNHLLANCLIFHNVCMMTRALYKLRADGMQIESEAVAALSPYIRSHINRFGQYTFDLSRRPLAVDYELPIFTNGAMSAAAITT